MFHLLLLAVSAALALTAPATAAMALFRSPDITVDWGAHKSLASLKCEDAKTIADMAATIKDLMWPNNYPAFSPTAKVKIFH